VKAEAPEATEAAARAAFRGRGKRRVDRCGEMANWDIVYLYFYSPQQYKDYEKIMSIQAQITHESLELAETVCCHLLVRMHTLRGNVNLSMHDILPFLVHICQP
jgi:hypothetical protein